MHQLCSVSQRRAGEIPSEGAPPELVADDAVVEHGEEEGARPLGAPHAVVPPPPHQLAVKLAHLRRRQHLDPRPPDSVHVLSSPSAAWKAGNKAS